MNATFSHHAVGAPHYLQVISLGVTLEYFDLGNTIFITVVVDSADMDFYLALNSTPAILAGIQKRTHFRVVVLQKNHVSRFSRESNVIKLDVGHTESISSKLLEYFWTRFEGMNNRSIERLPKRRNKFSDVSSYIKDDGVLSPSLKSIQQKHILQRF